MSHVSKEMQEQRVISRRDRYPIVLNATDKASEMNTEMIIEYSIIGGPR